MCARQFCPVVLLPAERRRTRRSEQRLSEEASPHWARSPAEVRWASRGKWLGKGLGCKGVSIFRQPWHLGCNYVRVF